jgi:hypothetical protein
VEATETLTKTQTSKTTSRPDNRVAVPARPIAVTTVNTVALGAAAVAATGTAGMIAVAGGVLAGGAVLTKVARLRRKRAEGTAKGSATGAKLGGTSPRAGAGSAMPGSGRSGAGRGSGGGRTSSGGGASGGSKAPSRLARAAAAMGMSGRRTPTAGSGASTRSGTSGTGAGRTGGTGSGRSTAGKVGGAARRTGQAMASGARSTARGPVGRAAGWAARKTAGAVAQAVRRAASDVKGGQGRSEKIVRALQRRAWRLARAWFQRKVMGRKPAPKEKLPDGPDPKDIKPLPIRDSIDNDPATPRPPVRVVPSQDTTYKPRTVAPDPSFAGGNMLDEARRMQEQANEIDRGEPGILKILEVLDHDVMPSLMPVAEAYQSILATAKRSWPIDPAVNQKIDMVVTLLFQAAKSASSIVNDIEVIDAEKLRELRNPSRPGANRYDHSRNGGA